MRKALTRHFYGGVGHYVILNINPEDPKWKAHTSKRRRAWTELSQMVRASRADTLIATE